MSIFVSIPSYADPDLALTLDHAIRLSSWDVPLTFGICEQVTAYIDAFMTGRGLPAHVKVHYVLYGEERLLGVGGARAAIERMYDGQDYVLMIDAHTRFEADWDRKLLDAVNTLPSHGLITGLMPPDPWAGKGCVPVTDCDTMDDQGFPFCLPDLVPGPSNKAYPSRHAHAGALFGRAWLDRVRQDPHIIFDGEESTLTARLWTAGLDLFHMALPFMHGAQRTPGRPWERPEWHVVDAVSRRRCRVLLGVERGTAADPALVDLDAYGLGAVPFAFGV